MASIFPFIRDTINREIVRAGLTLDGVLIKVTPGTRTSTSLTKGTNPTQKQHRFRGFYDDSRLQFLPPTTVMAGDRVVVLIGGSIQGGVEPKPGDRIILEDENHGVERLLGRDPAKATYTCLVRG